jgi:hypothetical protein
MSMTGGLEIQLVSENGRAMNIDCVSVETVLFTNGRERYRFDAGATDSSGKLSVPYSRLEEIRKENQAFALMDYNTALDECDDEVLVHVPDTEALEKKLTALRRWFPDKAADLQETVEHSNNHAIDATDVRIPRDLNRWLRVQVVVRSRA